METWSDPTTRSEHGHDGVARMTVQRA